MKKHALALAAVTALSGTAFSAQAQSVNVGGIGQQLVFPYYSVQGDGTSNENVTLMTITNTDRTNGKLVKVRFRGASNSDDVLDFTLALSPADVWTAAVTKGADGAAALTTYDNSCTMPALKKGVAQSFVLDRVKDKAAAESLEGYAEVITMADVPPKLVNSTAANPLFATIKHNSSGVATCDETVFGTYLSTAAVGASTHLTVLTTPGAEGLTGDWVLLNQKKTAGWSGSATALSGTVVGVPFWPQNNDVAATPTAFTSDPLFVGGLDKNGTAVAAKLTALNFDLPDLSTPYFASVTPAVQANATSAALATTVAMNQYWTESSINAVTDMLFSQPTRRYHVAYDYSSTTVPAVYNAASNYYAPANTTVNTKSQVCLKQDTGVVWPRGGTFTSATVFDREEYTSGSSNSFVISPNTGAATTPLCGEVAVVSIGAGTGTSALNASLTRYDWTGESKLVNGWMAFGFKAAAGSSGTAGNGLPVLGAAFIRVANGSVNYGVKFDHKSM